MAKQYNTIIWVLGIAIVIILLPYFKIFNNFSIFPGSSDAIHTVVATLVEDNSNYALYSINFAGYGSPRASCDEFNNYNLPMFPVECRFNIY